MLSELKLSDIHFSIVYPEPIVFGQRDFSSRVRRSHLYHFVGYYLRPETIYNLESRSGPGLTRHALPRVALTHHLLTSA
jgi:hypothetical protein